jgi:hypothetical protein
MPVNPTKTQNGTSPADDEIVTTERPQHFSDLLDHSDIANDPALGRAVGSQRFYLSGFARFMKFFPGRKAPFLKEEEFIDRAVEAIRDHTAWQNQSGASVADGVAANQLRRMYEAKLTYFTKPLITIVAAELALASVNQALRYWPYDHMRIHPALYNLNGFTTECLAAMIAADPTTIEQLKNETGQSEPAVFEDLSDGFCTTWRTAAGAKTVCGKIPAATNIGDVRCHPSKYLGTKGPSENERIS